MEFIIVIPDFSDSLLLTLGCKDKRSTELRQLDDSSCRRRLSVLLYFILFYCALRIFKVDFFANNLTK